jgi:hypothetical protein
MRQFGLSTPVAGHDGDGGGLPLRSPGSRIASGHFAFRNGHGLSLLMGYGSGSELYGHFSGFPSCDGVSVEQPFQGSPS